LVENINFLAHFIDPSPRNDAPAWRPLCWTSVPEKRSVHYQHLNSQD